MKLFVTSVLAEEPWKYDSKVVPMPWRQAEEDAIKSKLASGGLTLGYFNCDGNVSISKAIMADNADHGRYFHTLRSYGASRKLYPR
jgi:hypothetical protein